jgi:hypothetical protein
MISASENLVYLSQTNVVELTPSTALVGHDGWADARLGDFDGSDVILNDFMLIDELRCWKDHHTLDKPALRQALQALGDEAAGYLRCSSYPQPPKSQPPGRRGRSNHLTCRSQRHG